MLRLEGVSGGYASGTILHGIDLALAPGEITGLVGRNGVGKTSLARAVMGLLPWTHGRIELDGHDLLHLDPSRRAARGIGYMPQENVVFGNLSVGANLRIARRHAMRNGAWPRAADVIEAFPILRERNTLPAGKLSGGEQKILAFSRALLSHAPVLVLDEPTEGVQPTIVERFMEFLERYVEEHAAAVLLIEQNAEAARSVATDFAIMDKGEIVAMGAYDSLHDALHRHLGFAV